MAMRLAVSGISCASRSGLRPDLLKNSIEIIECWTPITLLITPVIDLKNTKIRHVLTVILFGGKVPEHNPQCISPILLKTFQSIENLTITGVHPGNFAL